MKSGITVIVSISMDKTLEVRLKYFVMVNVFFYFWIKRKGLRPLSLLSMCYNCARNRVYLYNGTKGKGDREGERCL